MILLYSPTMYYWPSLSPSISLSIPQLHEPTLLFRNLMSTKVYVVLNHLKSVSNVPMGAFCM